MGNMVSLVPTNYSSFISTELCINFGIQSVMWAVSALLKTEKLYDFTGSVTYLTLVAHSLWTKQNKSTGITNLDILLSAFVSIWAMRLGSFLFIRAKNFGDSRFNKVKTRPMLFLFYWLVQGLWAFITSLPAVSTIYLNDSGINDADVIQCGIGSGMWLTGFLMQAIADQQKYRFKSISANNGKFINEGLWSVLQYPNYYGEMLLWWGVYTVCSSKFQGWKKYIFSLSPIWVMFQLIYISGIRIQKIQANRRWKNDPNFAKYLEKLWF